MQQEIQQVIQHFQRGEVAQAMSLLRALVAQHPDQPNLQDMLGQAARAQGDYDAAIAAHERAVALAPQEPAYRERLAQALLYSNQGRYLSRAAVAFIELLARYPQVPGAEHWAMNAQTLLLRGGDPQQLRAALGPFYASIGQHGPQRMVLAAGLAIAAYLCDATDDAARYAAVVQSLRSTCMDAAGKPILSDAYFYLIYADFLDALLRYRQAHPHHYNALPDMPILHVIGESHALTAHGLVLAGHRAQAHLIMGAKAYYFGVEQGESWQYALRQKLAAIDSGTPVLLTFGEIDCRPNEGILHASASQSDAAMQADITALVQRYVDYLRSITAGRAGPVILSGVPAPAREKRVDIEAALEPRFLAIFPAINAALRTQAGQAGFGFLDLYAATRDADGWAKPGLHLDGVHLTPGLLAATLAPLLTPGA